MYDYWGKLLHMSEKFCNFASAMKGAPRERKEESGKRRVERGEWKEECGELEVRRPRTERPSAMKRRSVSDGEEERGEWRVERLTNKPNNGL